MDIRKLRSGFFLFMLAAVTLALVWVTKGFFGPVFWAATLAVVFRGPYRRLRIALGGRGGLAAALTTLGVILLVLIPLGLIGVALVNEGMRLYTSVASGNTGLQEALTRAEAMLPVLSDRYGVDLTRIQQAISGQAMSAGQYLAGQVLTIGQSALGLGLLVFVMLYTLFFFLRDGERLIDILVLALPLGEARERRLLERFATVTRATIKGTLVVGLVQGAIGGILFAVLGLGAPIFWGVMMALLSLLPAIGTALVWGPAALYLLLTGSVVKGVILLVAGAVIIGTVDNLLRPILVGRDAAIPDYLVLLATLGGIALFGLTGVIVGPVVAALFLVVWQMFIEEYGGLDNLVPSAPILTTEAMLRRGRRRVRALTAEPPVGGPAPADPAVTIKAPLAAESATPAPEAPPDAPKPPPSPPD